MRWFKCYHKLSKVPWDEGKKFMKAYKKYGSQSDAAFANLLVIGMRKLAVRLKSSVHYAWKFIHRLKGYGWIETKHICRKVIERKGEMKLRGEKRRAVDTKLGYYFFNKGQYYQFVGTEIGLTLQGCLF